MILRLKVTSENYDNYKEILKKYNYKETVTYSEWYRPDYLYKEKWRAKYVDAKIEINTLDELFQLAKELKHHEIIINNDPDDRESPYIEIYDSCRE